MSVKQSVLLDCLIFASKWRVRLYFGLTLPSDMIPQIQRHVWEFAKLAQDQMERAVENPESSSTQVSPGGDSSTRLQKKTRGQATCKGKLTVA